MYSVNDWRHKENQRQATILRDEGYKIEVTSNGYRVEFKGEFIAAAGVALPRSSTIRRTTRHKLADVRDNLQSALTVAIRHKQAGVR